ncbi:hypothetical protein FACS18942_06870 [Planctomycetales bacterium]|nr:hypothetical protein FACS18942_06870 [Planctomycetales bacterium]
MPFPKLTPTKSPPKHNSITMRIFSASIFAAIFSTVIYSTAAVCAQSTDSLLPNNSAPLTPPKKVRHNNAVTNNAANNAANNTGGNRLTPSYIPSAIPSNKSPLVLPDDSHLKITKRNQPSPIPRRFADTPVADTSITNTLKFAGSSEIRTAEIKQNEDSKAKVPRIPSFLSKDELASNAVLAGYAEEVKEQETERQKNNKTAGSSDDALIHPEVSTASFLNVIPGITTMEEVLDGWGEPLKKSKLGEQTVHFYSTEILNHIEVLYKNRVVSSIIVNLDEPFPEEQVREVLKSELLKSKPVLIPDENGTIIGEVFPEKSVMFLFSDNAETDTAKVHLVRQIAIEPVTSEPFVLRAEAMLDTHPSDARRDLFDALKINPKDAKACHLLAQIQLLEGQTDAAMIQCEAAIRLDERRPTGKSKRPPHR